METTANPCVLPPSASPCALCVEKSGLCRLTKPTRLQRSKYPLTTHVLRRNDARITHFGRDINKICATYMLFNNAAVQATSLAELFRLYARAMQTLCRKRSIMRQNVSKVDCIPYCCASHNILSIGHLHKSDGLNTQEKWSARLVAQASSLLYRRLPVGKAAMLWTYRASRDVLRAGSPRYSRLEACATPRPVFLAGVCASPE